MPLLRMPCPVEYAWSPLLWHEICTGRVPLLISSQSYVIVVYPLLRSIARTLP